MLLQQILRNVHDLQKDIDLLLESQESHFEDVEEFRSDLQELGAEVGETREGILESIEKNSNAVRKETDRIVGAASAATSAVVGALEAAEIVFGIGVAALLLWIFGSRKLKDWKVAQSAIKEESRKAAKHLDNPQQSAPLQDTTSVARKNPAHRGIQHMD